MDLHITDEV